MKKVLISITTMFMIFCVIGCSGDTSNEEQAEAFIKRALTAPDENISKAFEAQLESQNPVSYDLEVKSAMNEIFGDYVSEKTKEQGNSILYQQILMYHMDAIINEKEYTVDSIKVTEHGDNNYDYEATMNTNYTDDPIIITGNIQFDDNRINYMTITVEP